METYLTKCRSFRRRCLHSAMLTLPPTPPSVNLCEIKLCANDWGVMWDWKTTPKNNAVWVVGGVKKELEQEHEVGFGKPAEIRNRKTKVWKEFQNWNIDSAVFFFSFKLKQTGRAVSASPQGRSAHTNPQAHPCIQTRSRATTAWAVDANRLDCDIIVLWLVLVVWLNKIWFAECVGVGRVYTSHLHQDF